MLCREDALRTEAKTSHVSKDAQCIVDVVFCGIWRYVADEQLLGWGLSSFEPRMGLVWQRPRLSEYALIEWTCPGERTEEKWILASTEDEE